MSAKRPIFLPGGPPNFVTVETIDFEWFPGFSGAQKQKSIAALHSASKQKLGDVSILEVSTKSQSKLGWKLSAFNLALESDSLEMLLSIEAAFQGSKIFSESGQHENLYRITDGREVKRQVAEYANEEVVGFKFEGRDWPIVPQTAFYDWLYMSGLRQLFGENPELEQELLEHGGFTDIEFNPAKSINCQARSCALYVSLSNANLINEVRNPDDYLALVGGEILQTEAARETKVENLPLFD